jgi:hypothetical protein
VTVLITSGATSTAYISARQAWISRHRHPAPIPREDRVVDAGEAPGVLGHQLWRKRARAIAWDLNA